MSRFKKGRSGNPKGRPKGAKNRISGTIKEAIADFLDEQWDDFQKQFKKLEGREKIRFYLELMPYVTPKLKAVDSTLSFAELTEEEAGEVIRRIAENLKEKNEEL